MPQSSDHHRRRAPVQAVEETELISAQIDHDVLLVTILVNSMFQESAMLALDMQVRHHLHHNNLSLVLDCSRLTHLVSSQFLGILIKLQKTVRGRGGHMSLCGVTGNLHEVLEVTQLNRVFVLHDAPRDAVSQLGKFSAWEKVGIECVRQSEAAERDTAAYTVSFTPIATFAGIATVFLLGIFVGCVFYYVALSPPASFKRIPQKNNFSAVLKHNPAANSGANPAAN